jgi:sulfate adenylyltransferase subunit 1 (EFTu-like GTPase family)
MSVVMELDRDLDISRGDLLARPNNLPASSQDLEIMLCWMGEQPLDPTRRYLLQHTSRETKCLVRQVHYKLDVQTLHRRTDPTPLAMNDLARVTLHTTAPLFWDTYKKNRQTGCVLLVDEFTHATLAAGMIL